MKADKALNNLRSTDLLDLLQEDQEFRPQWETEKSIEQFSESLQKTAEKWKESKKESVKLDVGVVVKIAFPPSITLSFSGKDVLNDKNKKIESGFFKRLKEKFTRKKEETPDTRLKDRLEKLTDKKVKGNISQKDLTDILDDRGVSTAHPLKDIDPKNNLAGTVLKITDRDVIPKEGEEDIVVPRKGIMNLIRNNEMAKIEIDLSEGKTLDIDEGIHLNSKNGTLISNSRLIAKSIAAPKILGKSITTRDNFAGNGIIEGDLNVGGNIAVIELGGKTGSGNLKVEGDINAEGQIYAESISGNKITANEIRGLRINGDDIDVRDNLYVNEIDANNVTIGMTMEVKERITIQDNFSATVVDIPQTATISGDGMNEFKLDRENSNVVDFRQKQEEKEQKTGGIKA